MPFIVGLTGGIGSGKSTVASCLKEHGATVIDADQISRSLTALGSPVLKELQAEFGEDILDQEGELQRSLLAERAFATEQGTETLNSIMHTRIRERALQKIHELPDNEIVVYDMPLLVETKSVGICDYVVVVDASVDTRRERLLNSRDMSERDIDSRISRQASSEERNAEADLIITNNGSIDELRTQCERAWVRIQQEASRDEGRTLSQ